MRTIQSRTDSPEFFNRWSLSSIVLFAVNNAYLKLQFTSWFTGKLSDVLLCFFLPLFISSCINLVADIPVRSRLLAGCVITAIIFTSVKISEFASHYLNVVLTYISLLLGFGKSLNIADKSDLIALPMIIVAYYVGNYHARIGRNEESNK